MRMYKRILIATSLLQLLLLLLLQPMDIQGMSYYREELKHGIYEQLDIIERDTIGSPKEWIKSGDFYYEFMDKENKYITIRKIEQEAVKNGKLIIPKTIDGYTVLGIGLIASSQLTTYDWEYNGYWPNTCIIDNIEEVEKIILPESLVIIQYASLYGSKELKEIEFPKGVHVNSGAFGLWYEAPTCYCKPQKVTVYSDCSISFYEMSLFLFPSYCPTVLQTLY